MKAHVAAKMLFSNPGKTSWIRSIKLSLHGKSNARYYTKVVVVHLATKSLKISQNSLKSIKYLERLFLSVTFTFYWILIYCSRSV